MAQPPRDVIRGRHCLLRQWRWKCVEAHGVGMFVEVELKVSEAYFAGGGGRRHIIEQPL
jgi:hypothetical protein